MLSTTGCPMIFSLIGELSRSKGVHLFARAIDQLPVQNNISYHFVGDSTNSGADAFGIVETLCQSRPDVFFMGYIEDIRSYLRSVDVVLSCSVVPEALPTTLIEALASNCIICSSTFGGAAEILDLVPGSFNFDLTPESISKTIVDVVNLPIELRDELTLSNFSIAARHFKIRTQIDKLTAVYSSI
jgi:glycosyltransferase involved in cell wall biosynthesis